jgi:hypothetical protein
MTQQVRLGDFLGTELEEDFSDFDLTEIEKVLENLRDIDAIDLSHVEALQQQALRGADIITGYLGKMVKTIGYLETKVNGVKNKVALEYRAPNDSDGNTVRTTIDMKKWAAEQSPEVEKWQIKLANAKGSKLVLDRKYEILVKSHHHFKDIAAGLRRTILGYSSGTTADKVPEGYE